MINELKQYKKNWEEFVEWVENQSFYWKEKSVHVFEADNIFTFAGRTINNREVLSLLIDFLDSKNLNIGIIRDYTVNDEIVYPKTFGYEIVGDNTFREKEGFSSRTLATEAGIIKAFSILEEEKNEMDT